MQWMKNMMICYDELKYDAFWLRSQKLDEAELNYDSKQKLWFDFWFYEADKVRYYLGSWKHTGWNIAGMFHEVAPHKLKTRTSFIVASKLLWKTSWFQDEESDFSLKQ